MKTMTLNHSAKKRGISLIEGVLYLVLALSVIIGGIVFFQQAQLSNNVTSMSRAATGISSQVRGLYQNASSYGVNAETTQLLIDAGGVPANFVNADQTGVISPFGGDAHVASIGDATNAPYFAIQVTNLPEDACIRLGTLSEGGDGPMGTGILQLEINGASVDVPGGTIPADVSFLDAASTSAAGTASGISFQNPAADGSAYGLSAIDAQLACNNDANQIVAVYGR